MPVPVQYRAQNSYRAHSFGHILAKKREISRTFGLKKCGISRAFRLVYRSFAQFCQKCVIFLKVRDISRFSQMHELQ
jgi:hypothetical protein